VCEGATFWVTVVPAPAHAQVEVPTTGHHAAVTIAASLPVLVAALSAVSTAR